MNEGAGQRDRGKETETGRAGGKGGREKGKEREVSLPQCQAASLPLEAVSMPTKTLRLQEAPYTKCPNACRFL